MNMEPRATFVAELSDVDLSVELTTERFTQIHSAFLQYPILVFRNQNLSPARHVALAKHFGDVQPHVLNQYHHRDFPELFFLSNLNGQGEPNGVHPDPGTLHWHTDGSWTRRTTIATLLYSVETPARGGETHFADMCAAYESLPDSTKQRLAEMRVVHNLDFSRKRRHAEYPLTDDQKNQTPPVEHPVVRTHPETGRKALFLGDHAETIAGMDYEQARALIDELNAVSTRDEFVYRHRWRPHELVIWDNRCTLHRATEFDAAHERRVMRRATVLGPVA